MSRSGSKKNKKLITTIEIIFAIIVIIGGVLLTIYQEFGVEFLYIIPVITFILVVSIIVHLMFLWGIKKGVIVDRRQRTFRARPPSSYDPISSDSYEFSTNDDFLAERGVISEEERREQERLGRRRADMTVTVTPQTMKSKKLKKPSVDPAGLNCSVCKLMIRKGQAALECPFCGALFHKKHITEWLKEHDDCPICNQIITT
jgi:hypothetical protein